MEIRRPGHHQHATAEAFSIIDGRPCPEPLQRARRGRPPVRAPLTTTRTSSRDTGEETTPQTTTASTTPQQTATASTATTPSGGGGVISTRAKAFWDNLTSQLRQLCSGNFPFTLPPCLLCRRWSSGTPGRLQRLEHLLLLPPLSTFPLLFCGRTAPASATWKIFATGTVTTPSWLTSST